MPERAKTPKGAKEIACQTSLSLLNEETSEEKIRNSKDGRNSQNSARERIERLIFLRILEWLSLQSY